MGRLIRASSAPEPAMALAAGNENHWRSFENPMSAVSFGFVATAILVSMFLIMAVFERFLQRRSPGADGYHDDGDTRKQKHPSHEITVYPEGVSVLMPGETVPTFLAHPAPSHKIPMLDQNMSPRL